jgi:hypothetical protein
VGRDDDRILHVYRGRTRRHDNGRKLVSVWSD